LLKDCVPRKIGTRVLYPKEEVYLMKKIFILGMTFLFILVPAGLSSYARAIPEMPENYSVYLIKKGDTLWEISQRYLPDVNPVTGVKWISKANQMHENDIIKPGYLLNVPDYNGRLSRSYIEKRFSKLRETLSRNERNISRSERWIAVEATAYCSCAKCCGKSDGITASGTQARQGTLAVDPDLIPLGSRVYIKGLGWYCAEDTGRLIKGNRVDIWLPSHEEAVEFGRKQVMMRVAD
jgi:3D (Asp-Asp-Asp) domain-containing protein